MRNICVYMHVPSALGGTQENPRSKKKKVWSSIDPSVGSASTFVPGIIKSEINKVDSFSFEIYNYDDFYNNVIKDDAYKSSGSYYLELDIYKTYFSVEDMEIDNSSKDHCLFYGRLTQLRQSVDYSSFIEGTCEGFMSQLGDIPMFYPYGNYTHGYDFFDETVGLTDRGEKHGIHLIAINNTERLFMEAINAYQYGTDDHAIYVDTIDPDNIYYAVESQPQEYDDDDDEDVEYHDPMYYYKYPWSSSVLDFIKSNLVNIYGGVLYFETTMNYGDNAGANGWISWYGDDVCKHGIDTVLSLVINPDPVPGVDDGPRNDGALYGKNVLEASIEYLTDDLKTAYFGYGTIYGKVKVPETDEDSQVGQMQKDVDHLKEENERIWNTINDIEVTPYYDNRSVVLTANDFVDNHVSIPPMEGFNAFSTVDVYLGEPEESTEPEDNAGSDDNIPYVPPETVWYEPPAQDDPGGGDSGGDSGGDTTPKKKKQKNKKDVTVYEWHSIDSNHTRPGYHILNKRYNRSSSTQSHRDLRYEAVDFGRASNMNDFHSKVNRYDDVYDFTLDYRITAKLIDDYFVKNYNGITRIQILNRYRVNIKFPLITIDEDLLCLSSSIDITNPANCTYTFGNYTDATTMESARITNSHSSYV
ncbi:hypothetical protein [Pseudobutyrivibrio sp.]